MSASKSSAVPAPEGKPVPGESWATEDAEELYRIPAWSDGFFCVNEQGHVAVRPFDDKPLSIDLVDVVTEARRRNINVPLLLRFQDVLRARVRRLSEAFAEAIREAEYNNVYRGVYPIWERIYFVVNKKNCKNYK